MIKVYLARAMTGREKKEVVAEAVRDWQFFRASGFKVLCPVIAEKVKNEVGTINSTVSQMDVYWKRDKEMIREAHVLIDMSPHTASEGVKHELGYARYALWKPVVRVFPEGKLPSTASVAMYEDDYVCDSREEAIEYIYRVHGSIVKRFNWRIRMLARSLPRWVMFQMGEFK